MANIDTLRKILNNDLVAKWVNLRDYALDTLYAKSDIAAIMDVADKYGYGEWIYKPQIPKMTSNTSPYGEAKTNSTFSSNTPAWKAFDGDDSTAWYAVDNTNNVYLEYDFLSPINIKKCVIKFYVTCDASHPFPSRTFKLQSYEDGNWIDLEEFTIESLSAATTITKEFDILGIYDKLRFFSARNIGGSGWMLGVKTFQFYSWSPKGNVPIMTSASTPYGSVWNEGTTSSGYEAWKAFDGNDSTSTESGGSGGTPWAVTYLFAAPVCVKKIKIKTRLQYSSSNMNILQGSNDGSIWSNLKELTELQAADTEYEIPINNSNYYTQYRIYCASSGWNGFKSIQYYGRELSEIIPTMTSDNTPYGVASIDYTPYQNTPAYYAFDKKSDTLLHGPQSATYCHVTYEFPIARVIKYVKIDFRNRGTSLVIKGSNDANTWDTLFSASTPARTSTSGHDVWLAYLNNSTAYKYYYIESTGGSTTATPEFWEVDMFDFDYSERDWSVDNPKYYIYDHGVMPNGALTNYEKASTSITEDNGNELYVSMTGSGNAAVFYKSEDLSDFDIMRAVTGDRLGSNDSYGVNVGISSGITGANDSYIERTTYVIDPYSDFTLDISQFKVTRYVRLGVFDGGSGSIRYGSIKEWWLE